MNAGTVNVGGILDASAPERWQRRLHRDQRAHVHIASNAKITTKAASGPNGIWLIDPVDFTIAASGGDITGAQLATDLTAASVTIQTATGTSTATNLYGSAGTAGDINVNDTVSWGANTLTLKASNNININAPMNATGTAGLALKFGQASTNGGSSTYNVNAPVNLASGTSFSTQLGSTGTTITWTVITTLGAQGDATVAPTTMSLQGVNTGLTGHYVLGADINASGTSSWNAGAGFTPIGSSTNTAFAGVFDGLGHTITGLYINRPSTSNVGLFGVVNGGTVRNVGLVGGSVTGSMRVGGLAGVNSNSSTISNAYASSSVTGYFVAGGLVGYNTGMISNSYATGSVTSAVTGTNTEVGGLVGYNNTGGSISDSYASGRVTGIGAGGLVGQNFGTGISNSYWDITTSGTTSGIGESTNAGGSHAGIDVGLTTAQMKSAASFGGWNMASSGGSSATWRIYEGQSAPLLRRFLTPITVTANNASKTYDGMAYNGSAGVSYSATSNATLLGTVSYSAGTNAGSYTITPSGLYSTSSQGFDVSYATGALTVNKAHLTVTANNASRLYGAANPALTTTVSGFVNGESATTAAGYTGSGSATTTANAATNVGAAVITAGAGTLAANNYDFTQLVNGTLTVNPATLTYTATAASRTYGAGNPAFSGSVSGFVNGETLATATTGSASFTSAATTGSGVGSYAIDGSGLTANNGNYIFAQAAGNATALTVNKAALTVTASNASKSYGQAPTLTLFTSSGLQNGETIGSVTETSAGTATTASVAGGPYTITPSAATGGTFNLGNYNITYATGLLTVNKAHLTVTAGNASRLYGAANPTFTTTVSGFVNGESATTAAGYTGSGSATTTANAATNVGAAVITAGAGTLAANNYDFTQLVNGTLTVNPATLTYTATAASRTYGAGNPAFSGSVSGFVNGETLATATTGSASFTSAATTGSGVGSYAIDGSGLTANNGNYIFAQAAGNATALTVNKAALTVTASNASKSYGQAPTLTLFTSNGLQNGETVGSVTETSAGTTTTASVAGGPYTITPSAATGGTFNLGNYNITYATGLLTVNPAPLTVTASSASKSYGQTPTLTAFTHSALQNGETIGSVTETSPGTSATASVAGGPYTITPSAATGGTFNPSNYTISYATGQLTVNPASLTVTAKAAGKTYDGLSYSGGNGVGYSGFVNSETSSALGGTLAYSGSSQGAKNAGSYVITPSGLTSGNYTISFVDGTLTIHALVSSSSGGGSSGGGVTGSDAYVLSLLQPMPQPGQPLPGNTPSQGKGKPSGNAKPSGRHMFVPVTTVQLGSSASLNIVRGGVRLPSDSI